MNSDKIIELCRSISGEKLSDETITTIIRTAQGSNFPVYSVLKLINIYTKPSVIAIKAINSDGWISISKKKKIPDTFINEISELTDKGELTPSERQELFLKTRELELDENDVEKIIGLQLAKTSQLKIKKASKKRSLFLIVASLLAVSLISIIVYFNIYVPWKVERDAPRMYVLPNILKLRNSQSMVSDGNIIKKIPYGSEVVVYSLDSNWANVHVGDDKGFMGFPYKFLVDKKTFFEIDGIFGNKEARELVATSYLKHVLRKYFETHNMSGIIPPEIQTQFPEISTKNKDIWQIFAANQNAKYNVQAIGKVTGIDTSCFAVIIKNVKDQSKKILIFQFDEKDQPKLLFDSSFPAEFDGITLLSVRRKLRIKEGTLKMVQFRTPFFLCGVNSAFSQQNKQIIYFDGSSFKFVELIDNIKGF